MWEAYSCNESTVDCQALYNKLLRTTPTNIAKGRVLTELYPGKEGHMISSVF